MFLLDECEFSQSAYEVNEGDAVEVTLTFTKEISENITIPLMYNYGLYVTSMLTLITMYHEKHNYMYMYFCIGAVNLSHF